MNRKKYRFLPLFILLATVFLYSVSAWAATKEPETRTPITTVTLNVTSSVMEGDESGYVLASGTSDQYSIGNYEWSNSGEWSMGDVPKVKIYLHARNGYYFEKTTGKGKIIVNGAKYSTGKITDNKETLVVTVTLNPVPGTLDEPDIVEWVGYPIGKASWSAVDKAGAYELTLYWNGSQIYQVEKVNGTNYDFFPYMTRSGDYQFRVRAIPKDSLEEKYMTRSDWTYSDFTTLSADETPDYKYEWNSGFTNGSAAPQYGWMKNSEGWWYLEVDGSYPSNTWKVIDGKWYLFDNDGYMLTGWQNRNGKLYFLSENGDMQVGWLQDNRQWYYLGQDGAAVTGWCDVNGKRYCMNAQGQMLTGWWLIDGKWHYFNEPNGDMATNTYVGGRYLDQNGIWVR